MFFLSSWTTKRNYNWPVILSSQGNYGKKKIMGSLSIKHSTVTTGHHTVVGQVGRLNQSIEPFIRCFLWAYPSEDWLDWLYLIEFIYNNSKNSSIGQPPFLAFNGFLLSFSPLSNSAISTSGKSTISQTSLWMWKN